MKILLFYTIIVTFAISGCMPFWQARETLAGSEYVLIIDPGHGGADGGAVATDGTKESELNLSVALKTDAICALLGYKTVMTRRNEELDYPKSASTIRAKKVADQKARVELVNSTPNAVLMSIHQNIYSTSRPSGAQALYGKFSGSDLLAELIQANETAYVDHENIRNAAKISDDIYLLKKVQCPAVLIECGFMSNPNELIKLKSNDYQMKLAAVFAASYIQFLSETENNYA